MVIFFFRPMFPMTASFFMPIMKALMTLESGTYCSWFLHDITHVMPLTVASSSYRVEMAD
jgi:hypothetical protein